MNLVLVPQDDPILRTKCELINPRSPDLDLDKVLTLMFVVMAQEGGIGLAAHQVGINKRIFVMRVDGDDYVCINPKIEKASRDTEVVVEGCLSFPGKKVAVRRSKSVRVQYMTPKGLTRTSTLRGLKARCFQHELDHLDGVVFTDKGDEVNVSPQHL